MPEDEVAELAQAQPQAQPQGGGEQAAAGAAVEGREGQPLDLQPLLDQLTGALQGVINQLRPPWGGGGDGAEGGRGEEEEEED